jgi:Na+/proline symporter
VSRLLGRLRGQSYPLVVGVAFLVAWEVMALASLFLVTRAAAEGVRVYAVSIVVAIALGTGEIASIAIITLLTLVYTFEGGLAAVIWTDVVQTFIYIGGTLVGVFTILRLVPGGWPAIHYLASGMDKLRVFDFSFTLARPYTFWAGLIGGTFFTASHGTDQLIVQRLRPPAINGSRSRHC